MVNLWNSPCIVVRCLWPIPVISYDHMGRHPATRQSIVLNAMNKQRQARLNCFSPRPVSEAETKHPTIPIVQLHYLATPSSKNVSVRSTLRGGDQLTESEFQFSEDQRAIFASLRRTLTILGVLGLFTSSVRLTMALCEIFQQPFTARGTLSRLIPALFPSILPCIADISVGKVQLRLSKVFAEIESPVTKQEKLSTENDITSLLKALTIFDKHLKKKRFPTILKATAAIVALLTIALKGFRMVPLTG